MFRRGLAVLLCSAMLAGSLPETSFAAENAETVETAETDTAQAEAEEAEPEKQENDASTESGETVQTSQTAVSETQTVSGTEGAERTDIGETEKTEITETEANTEASEKTNEIETQTETATVTETETTTAAETQTETATAAETESIAETAAATETTTETEETATIVESGEETTEVVTEEETAEEVTTEEIENADTSGNEYVAVSNVKTTYNSISFDYEIKDSSVRYLYISNVKDGRYIGYNTSDSITITGLNPSTEYNISFAGYSVKEKFYEFSEKTAECPYDVKYEVTSSRADAITLSAEISAREGAEYKLPERFMLNWKCFDENGKHISDLDGIYSVYVSEDSLPKKITSIIEDPRYMFENTKYTFEMWISEPTNYDFYNCSQYATERKEVTTPKSVISDVDIKFTPSDSDSSVANYTLTTGSYKDSVEGAVVFRLKGSSGRWSEDYSSFSTQDGAATGELYDLALGGTYEYMINAAGFKKTGEFTNGEAKLKWDAFYDIGALDVVATFKLDEATKTEGASYDVYVGYKRHSEFSSYWETDGLEKGEDGSYKAVVSYLRPNTEYDIQLVVYENLSNGSVNRYEAFETVTTKASAVKTNIIKTYLNAVRFSAVFDSSVRTKYTEGVEVYPYIKGQDGTYTLIEDAGSIYLDSDNEYDDEFAISGLESNKVYEISFGYVDEDYEDEPYFEYGTMTFKTAADDRTITIDTPEAGVSNITINGTFKGSAVPYDDGICIVLLCRESGSDKWKTMDSTDIYVDEDDQSSDIERTFKLYADNLEGGKTYEYAVGIGTWNKQDIESLKDVKKGTIKLNPDNRKIEVETTSLLNGVVVRAKLLGQYIDNDNYAYIFYREKGKTDASWSRQRLSFYDDSRETSSVITSYNGEELKSGTTYEYKHSMSIPAKEEDYAGLDGGEFTYTQPQDDRALEIKTTESRTTARFAVTLSGNRAVTNYVDLFYREKGSQSWKRTSGSVSWDNHSAIELNVPGLSSKTEYEYTIGISNRYISSVDDIAAGKQNGTFTTKDDERKLGTPVITTGYSYADIAVAVDGLTDNDGSSYVSLYMKNTTQQNANWYRQDYNYVYSSNSVAKFSLNGLTLGTTYDYAFVISDNSRGVTPDSEEFKELSENKKLVDKFETKKSDYTLAITYGENSIFGKEILQLKAGSATYNEKNFDVTLTVRESETKDYITGRTVSLNSVDYSAETVFTNLSEKTKYDVTATLYAKIVRDNSLTREPVATKEYSFTTKAAAAPAELKADVTDLYLNSWNTDYQSYYFDAVNISVPDGASNEVTWTSSNPDVAYVLNSGIVIAGKPGEATITAASVLAPGVTTTVNVHVKDYAVIFVDKTANTATPTLYNSVYTFKNKESDNVAYATTTDNGKTFTTVKATGTSEDPNIAYWNEEKQCIISKNVGFTTIVLDAEGFKTDLYVTVYADLPDFELRLSPTEEDMDASYPALKKDGTYQIASGLDYYYQLSAIANPETLNYDINDVLSFTSSDPTVLTVSGNGSVKGLKKGTATVTVAYDTNKIKALLAEDPDNTEIAELAKHTDLADKTKTVTFDVRPLYSENLPEVHAITNVHKLLKDVTIGEGWSWRDPETPLYSLPDSGNAYYEFEAEYTGADFYNYEGTAKVYISTITGVDVVNNGSNVISANGTDSMNLIVKPVLYGYAGLIEGEGKDYEVSFTDTNVTVTPDTAGYKITAAKKGKYTLKPEIKVNGTVVATGSYAITAVDGKLIDHIDLVPETADQNVTIKGSTIYFNNNAKVESFKLKAAAVDREGNVSTDTKLAWTITDKSVADVDAKASDRDVTVKVKGEGHAVIQVTAGDEAKASAQYRLEVRNYKPRVEGDKITVNTAYDYDTIYGEALSANQYGAISIASAYGDRIAGVQVVDASAEDGINNLSGKVSKDFRADYYSGFDSDSKNHEEQYVIEPIDPSMAAGKHNVKLAVTTDSGFTYTYPLTVTVINKQPKVAAKVSNTMNLFYLGDKGYLDITLEKNKSKATDFDIESLKWSKDVSEGFQFNYTGTSLAKTPNVKRCFIDGSQVKVSNGKLTASDIDSGTVTIKLYGVREKYELPVAVKYSYKKPKLTTADWKTGKNVSTIIPSIAGGKSGSVYVVADKKQLYYTSGYGTENNRYKYYNEIRCENEKVSINKSGNSISFSYSGTETQFDIPLTIDSYNWREALTVTHKVKTTNPTAVLGNAKLTYNTNYNSEAYVKVSLKDYPQDEYRIVTSGGQYIYSVISAVDVAGADAVSQELLTNDKLKIEYRDRGMVSVKLNASKLGTTIPKGATYVLTPYCYDVSTKENKALNTLTLKITFTNKQVTVKASAKGKLDLAIADTRYDYDDYDYDSDYDWLTANSMAVTAKFANLGSGYDVVSAKLTGEYSKYFTLKYYDGDYRSNPTYYLKISNRGRGRLKAGQNYNLSIIYTLEDSDGNRISVKSNILKVKPIQKAPKLTVVGDNKILYAAAPDLYRICVIRTPYYNTGLDKDYYRIKSAYGSLDTNKDGKADIKVSLYDNYSSEGYAELKIQLTDKNAVVAAAKGKSYTIPVTVELVGRDGISKDATIKVKVTVKR